MKIEVRENSAKKTFLRYGKEELPKIVEKE